MAPYKKLPRSRMEVSADGFPSVMSYGDLKKALPKGTTTARIANAPNVEPYRKPNTTVINKNPRSSVQYKGESNAPVRNADLKAEPKAKASTASANTRKEDYKSPAPSKGSAAPAAYTGQKGDSPAKRGSVTSYVKDGYTYMKNAQGNFQNFKAGPQPTKRKASDK